MAAALLVTLPTEVLLVIAGNLTTLRDLAALTAAARRFHDALSSSLYQYGVRFHPELLFEACAKGIPGTVARLLAFTEDPTFCIVLEKDCSIDDKNNDHCQIWPQVEAFLTERRPLDQQEESIHLMHPPPTPRLRGWHGSKSNYLQAISKIEKRPVKFEAMASPIHIAAARGHIQVLQLLLQHEQGPSLVHSLAVGYCRTNRILPFQMHYRGPYGDALSLRIKQKDETSVDTPLQAALCAGQQLAARMLIDQGADLQFPRLGASAAREEHVHALHLAARFGCTRIIEYLCSNGHGRKSTDVNIRDSEGWTPLCHAIVAAGEDTDTVSCLLSLGADFNTPLDLRLNRDGFTPLHLACWSAKWSRASLLLEAGADCNAITTPDKEGVHARTIGPARAIDIVCMDIKKALNEFPTRNPDEAIIESRCRFLVTLVARYKADTKPCECSADFIRASPMAIAAANYFYHFELLSAFLDAGVTFLDDTDTVCQALNVIVQRSGTDIDHQGVTQVLSWLFQHGARLNHDDSSGLFQAVFDFTRMCWSQMVGWETGGFDQQAVDILKVLVEEGKLDPNLSAIPSQTLSILDRERANNTKVWSLFDAFLTTRPLKEQHRPFFTRLIEYGATRPTVLEALRDFVKRLDAFDEAQLEMIPTYEAYLSEQSRLPNVSGNLEEMQTDEEFRLGSHSAGYQEVVSLYESAKKALDTCEHCLPIDHPHYWEQLWTFTEKHDLITLMKIVADDSRIPTVEAIYRALFEVDPQLTDQDGNSDRIEAVRIISEMMKGPVGDESRWARAGKAILLLKRSKSNLA